MNGICETWGLSAAVFLPLVGALVIMALAEGRRERATRPLPRRPLHRAPARRRDRDRAAVRLLGSGAMQFEVDASWIPSIGARYHIGLDGISLPLFVLTFLVTFLCVIYSFQWLPEPRNPRAFFALILLLTTGMAGTFVALDLVLFFIFWELVLVPMYFLIAVWGSPGRREYAAIKFFLYTLFGSIFMLLGFIALYLRSDIEPGPGSSTPSTSCSSPSSVRRVLGRRCSGTSSSPDCSSASRSRCRCGRSTRGSRTRIPRRRRSAR